VAVNATVKRIWNEDRGVLSFEWILLITVIVIGIVGGLSAVRDGVIDELGDVAEAMLHVDQSWTVEAGPCEPCGPCQINFGSYTDPHANTSADTSILCRGRPASP
jgi:Flp pilus assembly pilin Flp